MSIGVCSQNHGNQVPGGICKLTGGANACSNAESDCTCAVSPKAQCCAYDTLGLPRCLGSGACGATAAPESSTERIPSVAGRPARPATPPPSAAASPPASPTRPARCAASPPPRRRRHRLRPQRRGLHRHRRLLHGHDVCNFAGGGRGTCGPPSTPPAADAGVCALYGQGCNAATPCCNGVQCTYSPTKPRAPARRAAPATTRS